MSPENYLRLAILAYQLGQGLTQPTPPGQTDFPPITNGTSAPSTANTPPPSTVNTPFPSTANTPPPSTVNTPFPSPEPIRDRIISSSGVSWWLVALLILAACCILCICAAALRNRRNNSASDSYRLMGNGSRSLGVFPVEESRASGHAERVGREVDVNPLIAKGYQGVDSSSSTLLSSKPFDFNGERRENISGSPIPSSRSRASSYSSSVSLNTYGSFNSNDEIKLDEAKPGDSPKSSKRKPSQSG